MIKVKALKWHQLSDYSHRALVGMTDDYRITLDLASKLWYSRYSGCMLHRNPCTLSEAKAACQAHHEQHVLSMIEEGV